jgi:hypothetical protein
LCFEVKAVSLDEIKVKLPGAKRRGFLREPPSSKRIAGTICSVQSARINKTITIMLKGVQL